MQNKVSKLQKRIARVIEYGLWILAREYGYKIKKDRVKNAVSGYLGGYMLVDEKINAAILGANYDASLHDLRDFIKSRN